jgi:hypothetical protein
MLGRTLTHVGAERSNGADMMAVADKQPNPSVLKRTVIEFPCLRRVNSCHRGNQGMREEERVSEFTLLTTAMDRNGASFIFRKNNAVSWWGMPLSEFPTDHELQAGPHPVDRAHLDVDEADRMRQLPDHVLGDVG